MTTITPVGKQQQLTELQQTVATKIYDTNRQILLNVLLCMKTSATMSLSDFVNNVVKKNQVDFSSLDQRTNQFFQKMMTSIFASLNQLQGLPEFFVMLTQTSGDNQIAKNLVEGIAFPSIVNLKDKLDKIKPSIVDDLIKS